MDWYWGGESIVATAERVERTTAAVMSRLRARGRSGAATRGRITIAELARRLGVSRYRVRVAMVAIPVRPIRLRRRSDGGKRPYCCLDLDQAEMIRTYLIDPPRPATLRCIALDLGVGWATVRRRAAVIGIDHRPHRGLGAKDVAALTQALSVWGEVYDACDGCGTTGTGPHTQHWYLGRCRGCWSRCDTVAA